MKVKVVLSWLEGQKPIGIHRGDGTYITIDACRRSPALLDEIIPWREMSADQKHQLVTARLIWDINEGRDDKRMVRVTMPSYDEYAIPLYDGSRFLGNWRDWQGHAPADMREYLRGKKSIGKRFLEAQGIYLQWLVERVRTGWHDIKLKPTKPK